MFRGRGREGEREGEKHRCTRETVISCLLHAHNCGRVPHPGMCPNRDLNQTVTIWFVG